jgi:integral membrane protein
VITGTARSGRAHGHRTHPSYAAAATNATRRLELVSTAARWFRYAAIAETISWVGLLIGMFFKYVAVHDDIGVYIFGRVHGAMFVFYLVTMIWAAVADRWPLPWRIVGFLASIPPFTGLIFEWRAEKRRTPADQARVVA